MWRFKKTWDSSGARKPGMLRAINIWSLWDPTPQQHTITHYLFAAAVALLFNVVMVIIAIIVTVPRGDRLSPQA